MYSEIFDEIKKANKIAIITHKTPDGDAFGSSLMLYEFVKLNFPSTKVCLYTSNYIVNENFEKMINGIALNEDETNFDLAVTVDCATLDRFDEFEGIFNNAKFTINIDHHQDNTRFAKLNFVKKISSCSEFLFNILMASGLKINKRIASVACAGMITDTNAFSNPDVNGETFLTIAKMFEFGVDVINIKKAFYSGNDTNIFKLIGRGISKTEMYFDDKLMIVDLTQQDFDDCGLEKDPGCLINQIFALSQAKSCFLITPRDGLTHISMRCVEGLNVNVVAKLLNGGGHICASAGRVDMESKGIKEIILNEMEKQLTNYVAPQYNLFD